LMLLSLIDYIHDWRNSKKDILSMTFHLNKQISLRKHIGLSRVTAVVMGSVSFVLNFSNTIKHSGKDTTSNCTFSLV
jgi:hypothetical protein